LLKIIGINKLATYIHPMIAFLNDEAVFAAYDGFMFGQIVDKIPLTNEFVEKFIKTEQMCAIIDKIILF
jgi:hypothetical protein